MRFVESPLADAFLIELEPTEDERGSFCRLFCSDLLKEKGVANHHFVQVNLSDNLQEGTLRGMHYQANPYLEAKIIYCLQGAVYDVIIDLRKNSPTYMAQFGLKLSSDDPCALFIPKGFAHGFLTLEDDSKMLYLMSDFYKAGFERGYRYDDPAFKIQWPFRPKIISKKDENFPSFKEVHALC